MNLGVKTLSWQQLGKGLLFLLTAVFLGRTAIAHSQEIQSLSFQTWAWECLLGAIALILLSEAVVGFLWFWVLDLLEQKVPVGWAVTTFFKTTLAKYLPGNVWHLVGRVQASREHGVALERVGFSVILEPLFLVMGGLLISLANPQSFVIQGSIVAGMVLLLHPWGMTRLARFLSRVKALGIKSVSPSSEVGHADASTPSTLRYPVREILAAMLFMLLRGFGFCLTFMALQTMTLAQLPQLVTGFSLAWVLSIVLPSPGGMGVFESAAIQVLGDVANPGLLLSTVVLYRFLCLMSEMIGVVLVVLGPKMLSQLNGSHHSLRAIAIPVASETSKVESCE